MQVCIDRISDKFSHILEEELIREICQCSQIRRINHGSTLVEIGQTLTHIPIVVDGAIKVMTIDDEGNELLLYYLEFGDTCAITLKCCSLSGSSTVLAYAEGESEILFIPAEKMEDWMIRFRSWRSFILDSYNSRMNEMLAAIDSLAFFDLGDRLENYLRDRAMVLGNSELELSHLDIANDLNSSRVVISRLMKKLENQNKIIQKRGKVVVCEFAD